MPKLSEIPITDLRLGDPVVSVIGTPGIITKLIDRRYASRMDDNEIWIDWDNGNTSRNWHYMFNFVDYVKGE